MKRIALRFTFCVSGILMSLMLWAQQAVLDSARLSMRSNPQSAARQLVIAMDWARAEANESQLLDALILQGELLMRIGQYDESKLKLDTALQLAQQRKDTSGIGQIYGHFGGIAFFQSQFDQAVAYLLQAISVSQDEDFIARTNNNLGSIFERIGDNDKALFYFTQALQLHQAANRLQLAASTLGNIGVILLNQGETDEAIIHFRESVRYAQRAGDTLALSIRWQNLGNTFVAKERYDSAAYYLGRALEASVAIKDTFGMSSILNSRAQLYSLQSKFELAITDLSLSFNIASRIGDTTDMMNAQRSLSSAYAKKQNFEFAYAALMEYNDLLSQLSAREQNQKLYELEAQYQNISKEKKLQEQEFILQREARESASLRKITLLVFLVALLSSWMLFSRWRYERKLTEESQRTHQEKLIRLEEEQKRMAAQSMMAGEEAERTRLARELHDSLGSMLSSIKLSLGQDNTAELVDRANVELRRIAHNLVPEALDRFGLMAAIEDICDEWKAHSSVDIIFQHYNLDESQLTGPQKLTIFSITQELVNNAIKHASPSEILIQIMGYTEGLHATIEDNGQGFSIDPEDEYHGNGIGLQNVRSRIAFWGGTMEIDSQEGKGSTIAINFPFSRKNGLTNSI
ncbi:MAG: tetratricopeptide repeat protein [Saprospiraceae bacterium]|nr:tetratricopeptide repeat protein [Saprospiraceae bacterium]